MIHPHTFDFHAPSIKLDVPVVLAMIVWGVLIYRGARWLLS